MFKTRTSAYLTPALAAVAAALFLAGCFGSDSNDDKGPSRNQLLKLGDEIYHERCDGCHGVDGEGGRGPRVANSSYVQGDKERLIRTVLNGLSEKDTIVVNGDTFVGGQMPWWRFDAFTAEDDPFNYLTDLQVASVLTYIRVALNDTLVGDCVNNAGEITCVKTPRPQADIDADIITVDMVTAVRDTLPMPEAVEL